MTRVVGIDGDPVHAWCRIVALAARDLSSGAVLDDADDGVLRSLIRDVPDFPEPGILFKDITPLLADAEAFALVVDRLSEHFVGQHIDKVVGVEARGFVLAAPVAHRLGAGLVPVRKPGKLPWHAGQEAYTLEYRQDVLEMHRDAFAGHPSPRAIPFARCSKRRRRSWRVVDCCRRSNWRGVSRVARGRSWRRCRRMRRASWSASATCR